MPLAHEELSSAHLTARCRAARVLSRTETSGAGGWRACHRSPRRCRAAWARRRPSAPRRRSLRRRDGDQALLGGELAVEMTTFDRESPFGQGAWWRWWVLSRTETSGAGGWRACCRSLWRCRAAWARRRPSAPRRRALRRRDGDQALLGGELAVGVATFDRESPFGQGAWWRWEGVVRFEPSISFFFCAVKEGARL